MVGGQKRGIERSKGRKKKGNEGKCQGEAWPASKVRAHTVDKGDWSEMYAEVTCCRQVTTVAIFFKLIAHPHLLPVGYYTK